MKSVVERQENLLTVEIIGHRLADPGPLALPKGGKASRPRPVSGIERGFKTSNVGSAYASFSLSMNHL